MKKDFEIAISVAYRNVEHKKNKKILKLNNRMI